MKKMIVLGFIVALGVSVATPLVKTMNAEYVPITFKSNNVVAEYVPITLVVSPNNA